MHSKMWDLVKYITTIVFCFIKKSMLHYKIFYDKILISKRKNYKVLLSIIYIISE